MNGSTCSTAPSTTIWVGRTMRVPVLQLAHGRHRAMARPHRNHRKRPGIARASPERVATNEAMQAPRRADRSRWTDRSRRRDAVHLERTPPWREVADLCAESVLGATSRVPTSPQSLGGSSVARRGSRRSGRSVRACGGFAGSPGVRRGSPTSSSLPSAVSSSAGRDRRASTGGWPPRSCRAFALLPAVDASA